MKEEQLAKTQAIEREAIERAKWMAAEVHPTAQSSFQVVTDRNSQLSFPTSIESTIDPQFLLSSMKMTHT